MGPLPGAGWMGVPCSEHKMLRAPSLGDLRARRLLGVPSLSLGGAGFSTRLCRSRGGLGPAPTLLQSLKPKPPQCLQPALPVSFLFRQTFWMGPGGSVEVTGLQGHLTQLCLQSGGSWREPATCSWQDCGGFVEKILRNTTCLLVAAPGSVRGKKYYFPVGSSGNKNILQVSAVTLVQTVLSFLESPLVSVSRSSGFSFCTSLKSGCLH